MSIQAFIQDEMLLPRLRRNGILVLYDPAQRYRTLCLALGERYAAGRGREGVQSTICFCMLCGPDTFSLFVSDADARIIIALWPTL